MTDDDDLFEAEPDGGSGLGMVFTARYGSDCESCLQDIEPGESIRADGCGGWIHASPECERVAAGSGRPPNRTQRAGLIACPRCTATHPGECA